MATYMVEVCSVCVHEDDRTFTYAWFMARMFYTHDNNVHTQKS